MSATTAGAFKVVVENAGLGLAVYRDRAPRSGPDAPPEPRPYATVSEGISVVPERHGDQGDPHADRAVTELIQIDLWERLKGADAYDGRPDDPVEDPTLIRALLRFLHGCRPVNGPTLTYGVTVDSTVRLVEHDRGVVHHAITVRVRRGMDDLPSA